jgi:hypothetical protein
MRRPAGVWLGDKDFSFYSAVNEFEAKLIGQALEEAGECDAGSQAARPEAPDAHL